MTAGPDVLTWLRGGLGNQLFAYAATLRALRETGRSSYELLFVEGWFSPDITDVLSVSARHPSRRDRARWSELARQPGPLAPVLHATARAHERRSRRFVVSQFSPFEPPTPLPAGRPVLLETFAQHPGWWADDWRTVASELAAQAPTGYDELVARRRAVINVRQRADYVREMWQLPPAYYDAVVDRLRGEGIEEVVLQADEPAFIPWLRRFVESAGLRVVDPVRLTGEPARDDFWNLVAGATLVLPNSTFSWWAGAVATARDPDVRVLYPDPWLPNRWTAEELPDMGLPGWTSVPSHLSPIDGRPVFRLRPPVGARASVSPSAGELPATPGPPDHASSPRTPNA